MIRTMPYKVCREDYEDYEDYDDYDYDYEYDDVEEDG